MKLFLFIALFSSFSYFATANTMNFTTVLKPVPQNLFLTTKARNSLCSKAFGQQFGGLKKFGYSVTSYASHMREVSGRITENFQGEVFVQKSTNDVASVSRASVEKLIHDWQNKYGYTKEYTDWVRDIHNSLAQDRVSIIRVEESPSGVGKEFDFRKLMPGTSSFSMLRIYDSSEVPLVFGNKWTEQKNSNLKSVAEMALGFDLTNVLERAGIERGEYTWSIGLIDSLGGQVAPAKFLFGQFANQLDVHYNGRNYFVRKNTDLIENRDLDVIGYTNERTMKVYEKLFGIKALREAKTKDYIRIRKNDQDFYLFHFKGSEFIEMNFKLEQMFPKYASNDQTARATKLSTAESILRNVERLYPEVEHSYRPAISDLQSFLVHTRALLQEFSFMAQNPRSNERDLFVFLAKLHIFNSRIPHNSIKTQLERFSPEQIISMLDQIMPFSPGMLNMQGMPQGANPKAAIYGSVLGFVEIIMYDPVKTMINKMQLKQ